MLAYICSLLIEKVDDCLPFRLTFVIGTSKDMYLHEVLEGSELYFPPQKEPERVRFFLKPFEWLA